MYSLALVPHPSEDSRKRPPRNHPADGKYPPVANSDCDTPRIPAPLAVSWHLSASCVASLSMYHRPLCDAGYCKTARPSRSSANSAPPKTSMPHQLRKGIHPTATTMMGQNQLILPPHPSPPSRGNLLPSTHTSTLWRPPETPDRERTDLPAFRPAGKCDFPHGTFHHTYSTNGCATPTAVPLER